MASDEQRTPDQCYMTRERPRPELPEDFLSSVRYLCVCARTSGGVAGRDEGLCLALDRVEAMLVAIQDPDWQAQARSAMSAHIHDDDGTVEGCPGCFP